MSVQNILSRMQAHRPVVAARVMVVPAAALLLVGSRVDAGIIIPFAHSDAAMLATECAAADLCIERSGSSSAPPAENTPASPIEDHQQIVAVAGVLQLTGGASAPVQSSSGHTTVVPAAVFLESPAVGLLGCRYADVERHTAKLPQPPLGELLDPPRICA